MKTTVTLDMPRGVDPFTEDISKRSKLRKLANLLRALAASLFAGHPTLRAGTAQASGTVTAASVQANDTISINGVALTAKQHYAKGTITITAAGVDVDDTYTLNGVAFVAKAAEDADAGEFDVSGTDAEAAESLYNCLVASEDEDIVDLFAFSVASNVVTVRYLTAGTAGNAITHVSSDAQLAVSGSGTLTGGTAVGSNQFDMSIDDDSTAESLATAVGATASALIANHVTAEVASAVVTVSAKTKGTAGNAVTLESSHSGRLLTSGARLTGGTDDTFTF